MPQGRKIDIRSLLQIAKRWKWLLIIPTIVAFTGTYAYLATTPPQYTSTTTILLGANVAITSDMSNLAPGTQVKGRFKMVDVAENIRQIFLSESTLNKVIDRAGLKPSGGMLERAKEIMRTHPDANAQDIIRGLQLEWLSKKVETAVTFPKRGNYVQVSITHTNPDLAYRLAKNLAEVFIEESLLAERVGPRETFEFASKQLEVYTKKLQEARERLRQFQTGMVLAKTQSSDVNVQNEAQINTQIKSLAIEINGKRSQLQEIESQMGGMNGRIPIQLSGKAAGLRAQMMEKISNVALLMVHTSWRDPQVIKLNQEIAELREELQQEILSTGTNAGSAGYSAHDYGLAVQRQMVLTDLELLNRQKAVLEGLLQTYKQSLTQQPSQELQLRQLQNEVKKWEETVETFDTQARGSQIVDALRRSDAEVRYKILDPANRPVTPNTEDQQRILMMAFFGGLGFGIGLIYLIEFFDHSFKSVEEVEQVLGLTVLGIVPKLNFGEK
ncbi:MAG: Wzz/FepE/Etk N-terminal domain-containing protein [candidate division KSB1 bacterium]|nr:Wzz/FepE/Etk N-terminal domain-containing protein [candidate division KSB1 bacterium]MDZ7302299.1 Wzz/FepE/Etk N-terminal domain-containing protein [candidate division KSB1 bacterium]MDZ7311405.1 Wzz/FepE/Etk N-terminal domain-containing protein [candidate division KSB1 bacterium]